MELIDKDFLLYDVYTVRQGKNFPYEEAYKKLLNRINNASVFEPRDCIFAKWQGVSPLVDSIECSNCGYQVQSVELITPYCPWCGAKMENFEMAEDW